MRRLLTMAAAALLLVSCGRTTVSSNTLPPIFPDYADVTIPAQIAPMNFNLMNGAKRVYVRVRGTKGGEMTVSGKYARFNPRRWHELAAANVGGDLIFTVLGRTGKVWTQYRDFKMHVSEYPLEDYGVTYRRFAPGYETYSRIGLYQRCLGSFKETPMVEGSLIPGQCVGCHTANATDPQQFLFHVRGKHGATVMQLEGERKWLATKTDSTIGNAVYSYWHPSGNFAAHSTNFIHQNFWTAGNSYVEVYDDASDVFVHNVRTDELILSPLLMTSDFETFPAFSRDGKTLFFCSAPERNVPAEAEDVHYSLCAIGFDPETQTFADHVDTIINGPAIGKSITFPRPSYDGKWLMFSLADFGCFPNNHMESELYLLDLRDGSVKPMTGANSEYNESFHNWSSDSHWILVTSRRIDSLYNCIYISSLDEEGNTTKSFLLPQRNPWKFYHNTLFTFNVPDFTKTRVESKARGLFKEAYSDKRVQVKVKE